MMSRLKAYTAQVTQVLRSISKSRSIDARLFLASMFCWLAVHADCQANPASPLMTELSSINYYSAEQPLLNIMKTGTTWTTANASTWDTGEEQYLNLDANGYPINFQRTDGKAASFTFIQVLLQQNLPQPYYPAGQYIVLYDGQGTLGYKFDAALVSSAPGRDVINITPSGGGFDVMITATDPNHTGNYIRNIRIVQAQYESAINAGQIFNPAFLSSISSYRGYRFMDWMNTNNSTQANWSTRTPQGYVFWGATAGVPVEIMVALLNQQKADGWFNMPAMATNDYMTQFATLVHQTLNSTSKAYIEFSNETWNYGFSQASWIQSQAQALWPSNPGSLYDGNRSWYGMRAAQMCDIWKAAWGADSGRVVCVLAAQAAGTYSATQSLSCPLWTAGAPCSAHGFSAIAIAPYFGYDVPDSWTTQSDGGLASLFTEITKGGLAPGGYPGGMIKQALDWVAAYKSVAAAAKLDLIAYEGGQSLVNPNDAALSNLYIAANRDARMGTAYAQYFQGWKNAGGNLFSNFADILPYSKYGSWGSAETIFNLNTPKYNALQSFITANPCWWAACNSTAASSSSSSSSSTSSSNSTALAPLVSILSPTAATMSGVTHLLVVSFAQGRSAAIASMTISSEKAVLQTCAHQPSCAGMWQGLTKGAHTLTVVATDTAGNKSQTSMALTVQ